MSEVRTMPSSNNAEILVLGSMFNSINSLNIASDSLDDADFFYTEHKTVFKALKSAYLEDKPADIHLIAEELTRQDLLKSVGGVTYLVSLCQSAAMSVHIESYIKILKDKSILRKMIKTTQIIEQTAFNEPLNVEEVLIEAQGLFHEISQGSGKDTFSNVVDVVSGKKSETGKSFSQILEERKLNFIENGDKDLGITGISSGFIDLDNMINGLNGSNLIILAARPAMGKTALAVNIAEHVCYKLGMPVGIFSLEMGTDQIIHRMMCSLSGVESEKIKKGSYSKEEFVKINSSVQNVLNCDMFIDDQAGLKITDLRSRARRMKEVHGIKFLVIDYLQLVTGSGIYKGNSNREGDISEVSRSLKNLAKDLNIPILCLSQLSRKVEERAGHRPMMSDLRESGSIEQDADIVMFLLRREYYDAYDKPGMAELIIAKNRHGSVGNINLTFKKEITRFENYTSVQREEDDRIMGFERDFS